MKNVKVNFDVWIQLTGMLGVLGGLIFVGLEMQQSQRIALAAQHQARSEMFMDQINAHTEAGITFRNYTADEQYANINGFHALSVIFENDFIQYELGLMDEDLWRKKQVVIKRLSGICEMAEIWPGDLPEEFMKIVKEGSANGCRPMGEDFQSNQP
jgi:hypothetical protein|tara:strand:- start:57 stop:524 length:468 start_codon:yes stop_codon:yes gene_type:complete